MFKAISRRRIQWSVFLGLGAVAILCVGWLSAELAQAQPREYDLARYVDVPNGEYSAIVFAVYEHAEFKALASIIHVNGNEFPVITPAGQTTVIPFEDDWKVTQRVYIELSPHRPVDVIKVWGIGEAGPVMFPARKTK